ncbi:hypothetical protein HDK90DRAFT_16621 [Phyllosticta capitalensis]|uniref:Mediator complex subunit 15 KIX domain-containing protein n=1 Tax=Phyllosticta capitalensis TaxID=121624 RepID=A0ABR1Z2M0_9PEZI
MNGQPMQPVMGGPPQPTPQQQQHQQRIHHIVLQHLRNSQQQLPPGWYTSLGLEHRLHAVLQLYTGYRLAKPDLPDTQILREAQAFEVNQLVKTSNKDEYLVAIRKHLADLKNFRQRAAQGTQASMMQQGNAGANMQLGLGSQTPMQPSSSNQGQNPLQQQFAPQLQHQMQNSPVAMAQNPSSMGMENPGMQAQQNRPQPTMNQMPGRPQMQVTPQEEAQISDITRKIRARITAEDEAKIRAQFAQLPEEKRLMLDKPGVDVLLLHSRQRAMAMFLNHKKQQMQAGQAGGANPGQQPGQGPGPAARVNSSQGPGMMQRTPQMGPAQPQSGAMPGNDFDFTQLTNQQAAAMRSAQAGHDVVPASNNSAMNGLEFNPMNGGQPGSMGGQGMPGGPQSRPPSQQPSFSLQQAQQQAHRENAIRSIQAQQAAAQARNQGLSPAQMQLAMRNQQMVNMGQGQGGGMPMLTRPMAPPGPQGRATPQPGQQVPQNVGQGMDAMRALQMAQQRAAQAQAGMPGAPAPNRASRIPPDIPEPMRQTIMGLPEDKFQTVLNRWAQARQMQAGANNGQQQPAQQFGGLQGPRPGMPMMGGANMPPFMQQGQPQGMNPEIQQRLQQEMMLMRQQQMQQQQQHAAQQQPQRMPPPLTPQVLHLMDQTPFPPSIAGQIRTHAPVPENLKLWGQLKEWVARNPALPPHFSVDKLNEIQRLHYAKITSGTAGMINLGGGVPTGPVGGFGLGNPNGQAPQAPMMPAGPNQNQMQQQIFRQRMAQLAQSVTPAEIAKLRQMQGPKAAGLTDDQLRHHIVQLKMAQAQRAQQNPQISLSQPPPGGMAISQPPSMQQPQRPAQPGQPQQTPQMKPGQQTQGPPRPAQPPSQPPDATPNAQPQKGVKRPNDEGTDSQEQGQAQAPPMQPTQSQHRPMGMTKEQFESLPPQQQAAYRARMAQAQGNKNAILPANMRDTELKAKFLSMMQERRNEFKVGEVVQLSNEERNQMANDAGKLTGHLSKLDQCLFIDWVKHKDEAKTKRLIFLRTLFHHQIDTNTRGLKAEVTLDPGKMHQLLLQLSNFMKQVMIEQSNDKTQQSNSTPEGAQAADQATGPAQGQQAELNSANLEKLRQAQQQRPRQSSGAGVKPPNAPIATQPPFQIGAQSPHGAPMYAPGAVNNLTPEKLKMPPKKKAKTSASSTPQTTPMPAPSPHVGTKPSPDVKREAAAPAAPVKPRFSCAQLTCEFSVKGFDTKEDLEAHVKEAHAKVEDPLQFAVDSLAEGLGLNPDGSSKETKIETDANRGKPVPTAPKVQPPAKAGQTPVVKGDGSTPAAAAGATPMNRVPTQQGAKGSPSANFKTPQANIKAQTPGSGGAPAMNRTPSRAPAARTSDMAPANTDAAGTKTSLDNPWDDCPLSPSQMYGMFADEDVAKAVMDMPAEYFVDLNEKIATMNKDESGATPATTPSPASTKDSNQTTSTETSDSDSLVNVDWDKKKIQNEAEFGQMMSKLLVFDDSADMTLTLASDEQDGTGSSSFWRDKLPSTTQDIPGWETNALSEPFDFFGAPPAPSDDDALLELFPGIGKSDMDIDMADLAV